MTTDYITPQDYIPGTIADIKVQRAKRGNAMYYKRRYIDVVAAFDIETSTLPPEVTGLQREQSSMYMWQLCLLDHFIMIGRTWEEFKRMVTIMNQELEDADEKQPKKIVLWVHNLSYEFQFLKGIFPFDTDAVFCTDSRRILKADLSPHIELRCSYLHSNMSLSLYLDKMHTEHRKLSGTDFDYKEIRYPWTPLTDEQIRYGIHDVLGLCEALTIEMAGDGDNLQSVPLTSTGYVRRDIRKAMHTASRTWLPRVLPPADVYKMLEEAFRGGDTHANRRYSARVIENVRSADRSSSYPGVQMNAKYPMGEWNVEPFPSREQLYKLIKVRHRAVVCRITLHNVKLLNRWEGCPYLPRDKCKVTGRACYDNGRILSAETVSTTVTDIDLEIIDKQYQYDTERMEVHDIAYCAYMALPESLKGVIRKYYRLKTELKQDEHSPDFDPQRDVLYTKSKNRLNAIYGCSAQNVAKDRLLFHQGDPKNEYKPEGKPFEQRLEKAYSKAFFSYAFGVWCTAHARKELHDAIDIVNNTKGAEFIYCDTDSVKYIGNVDWSRYNARKVKLSTKSGAYATDPHGTTHYMEVFEEDARYQFFAVLGSKKYAFIKEGDDRLKVTIAGVTKALGGAELEKGDKYGCGIERFCMAATPGQEFLFKDAGGQESLYNDHVHECSRIDNHLLMLYDNVVIRDSTYLLGVTEEYGALIQLELLNRFYPDEYWVNDIINQM